MSGVIKLFEAKGSLSRLDLSGNNEHGSDSPGFIRPIASALKTNTSITELSLSGNKLNPEAASIFSDAIPDMGSLASLDISNNYIGSEQEAIIKQICTEKPIALTCEDDDSKSENESECGSWNGSESD